MTQEIYDRRVRAMLDAVQIVDTSFGHIVYHRAVKLATFITFLDAYRFKVLYIISHLED